MNNGRHFHNGGSDHHHHHQHLYAPAPNIPAPHSATAASSPNQHNEHHQYDNSGGGGGGALLSPPLTPAQTPSPSATPGPYTRSSGSASRRTRLRIRMVQSGPFVRDYSGSGSAAQASGHGHRHGDGNGSGSGSGYAFGYGYGLGHGYGDGYGGNGYANANGYDAVDEKKKKDGNHRTGGGLLPTSAKDAHFVDRKAGFGYDSDEEDGDVAREKSARRLQTRHSYEGRVGDTLAFAVGSISMMFSAAYTTYLILSANPHSLGWFAYHPPLQMLALSFFTISILLPQPTTAMHPKTRGAAILAHQLVALLLGVPALAGGTWAIYHAKHVEARVHFKSRHAQMGAVAALLVCAHVLMGITMTWLRSLFLCGCGCGAGGAGLKRVWKFHRLAGYIVYPFLLYVGHIGGAKSMFTSSHASGAMRFVCYTLAPLLAILAIYSRIRLPKLPFVATR